jgi:hypothetical protein
MSARFCCGDVKLPEKNSPSGKPKETQNRVLIVGRSAPFRNAADGRSGCIGLKRYIDTEFAPRFKSLLTLLELTGGSLHHERITGMTHKGVD